MTTPDSDETEIERIRSQHRAEIADVAARRRAAWDAYKAVEEEFLTTFRRVQRAGLLKSKELEEQGADDPKADVKRGMSRATFYRELAALAAKEERS
jgi:hypothetical protein